VPEPVRAPARGWVKARAPGWALGPAWEGRSAALAAKHCPWSALALAPELAQALALEGRSAALVAKHCP
jgi:hypothetical protein